MKGNSPFLSGQNKPVRPSSAGALGRPRGSKQASYVRNTERRQTAIQAFSLPQYVLQSVQGGTEAAASSMQQLWETSRNVSAGGVKELWEAGRTAAKELPTPDWLPFSNADAKKTADKLAIEEARHRKVEAQEREKAEAAIKLLQSQADFNEAYQVMKNRAAARSQPGKREDKFKLGLVIEGGGMRGACSGGGLQALHDLGLRDCFDAVYGSSAGAINATYFLAGQRHGVDIYSEDISNTQFIDLRRLFPKKGEEQRPALDLEFLLDNIMNKVKPLDWQAVIDSPIPLKIVASCLDTLQPILLQNFEDEHDLRECLRASAAVPVVAGNPVKHRGRRLVDAAVFEAIPLRAAIADGCTHCIVLPTRPPFKKGDLIGKVIDEGVSSVIKRAVLSPDYMKAAWVREVEYQRGFGITPEELLVQSLGPKGRKLPGLQGCSVFPVFPGPASSYSPLCTDAATVMLGIAEGRKAVVDILGSLGTCPLPQGAPKKSAVPERTKKLKPVKVAT